MDFLVFTIGIVLCAALAISAARLLTASLWLAGVSVFTALALYRLGAWQVAVIELSVGAGLVTVLFVFAIAVAGDEAMDARPLIPKPLAWVLIASAVILLGLLIFPLEDSPAASTEPSFEVIFWEDRILDVLLHVVMIFTGVLGVLGLLAEPKRHAVPPLEARVDRDTEPDLETSPHPITQEELV